MKFLTEETLRKALPEIKKGDILTVVGDTTTKYKVISISNSELIVMDANKKGYLLLSNAFSNGSVSFFTLGKNGQKKGGKIGNIRFMRVDRDGKTILRINDDESNDDVEAREKVLKGRLQKQEERKVEFLSTIQNLIIGEKLVLLLGKVDKQGKIDESTESRINFLVMTKPKPNYSTLEYIDGEGPLSDEYKSLDGVNGIIIGPKSPIIHGDNNVIKIKLFSEGGEYLIDDVLDVYSEEMPEDEINISKEDILNNKFYRDAMIKDAGWVRKLFGNNAPRGIIPAMKLINGRSSNRKNDLGEIKNGNQILFKLISEELELDGVRFEKDKKYFGRVKSDYTVKIPLKNQTNQKIYAKIKIGRKDTFNQDIYEVEIQLVKDFVGFNDSVKKNRGRIQILNYNYN